MLNDKLSEQRSFLYRSRLPFPLPAIIIQFNSDFSIVFNGLFVILIAFRMDIGYLCTNFNTENNENVEMKRVDSNIWKLATTYSQQNENLKGNQLRERAPLSQLSEANRQNVFFQPVQSLPQPKSSFTVFHDENLEESYGKSENEDDENSEEKDDKSSEEEDDEYSEEENDENMHTDYDDLNNTMTGGVVVPSRSDTRQPLSNLKIDIDALLSESPMVDDAPTSEADVVEEPRTLRSTVHSDLLVDTYAKDIYDYLRQLEMLMRPNANYMSKQEEVTVGMRSILVDWLVEVAEEYRMRTETLYLAISFIDRFLSSMSVVRNKLQLVGTACMLEIGRAHV